MITLKKAFEIAQTYCKSDIPLSRIADDTKDFWVFHLDTDEVLIGPCPTGVDKKDGRAWRVFPPSMTEEQLEALENAKEVEVPL